MNFVKKPNLPQSAAVVIVSPHMDENAARNLEKLGISVMPGYDSQQPVQAINGHPDTNIIHMGDDVFVCSPSSVEYYRRLLEKNGARVVCGDKPGEGEYPLDVAYNAAIVGDFMIHNFKATDKKLLDIGYTQINVNQGYSKCSVCPIAENAIITDDESISAAARKSGIDTLLISKGSVRLGGLDYGFFGGACGKIAADILAVNGDINKHPDSAKITDFAEKYGVKILSLSEGEITDIGSIIPICERGCSKRHSQVRQFWF